MRVVLVAVAALWPDGHLPAGVIEGNYLRWLAATFQREGVDFVADVLPAAHSLATLQRYAATWPGSVVALMSSVRERLRQPPIGRMAMQVIRACAGPVLSLHPLSPPAMPEA